MLFSMRRFDDTRTRLIFSVTALMVALAALFVFLYVAQLKNLEQQRRNEIRRIVQVASRSIAPILARYNQGMLPKEEALRQVTDLIRRMTYDDVFGPNYVFMSDYDGTMLVQPYERAKEGTNQAELRDSRGVFIIRALVERARAGGGYVSYEYPPPNSEEPQRKISYVAGIPELSCYIGTGMYVTDLEKDFRLFMGKVLLLSLVLLGGGLTLAARLLKPLFSSYAASPPPSTSSGTIPKRCRIFPWRSIAPVPRRNACSRVSFPCMRTCGARRAVSRSGRNSFRSFSKRPWTELFGRMSTWASSRRTPRFWHGPVSLWRRCSDVLWKGFSPRRNCAGSRCKGKSCNEAPP
jgi:hypothetical protein